MNRSIAESLNEHLLASLLELLTAAMPESTALVDVFDEFVRTASDAALVRINPIQFAQQHGLAESATVELFLRARKVGLATMEWQYICPGCGEIVERLPSLTSSTSHYWCQVCSAERTADLSDFIEVTFTVSEQVRAGRYHDPSSLPPDDHFFGYRFTPSAEVGDGVALRDHLRGCAELCVCIEAGETSLLSVTAKPGFLWFTNGPALSVGPEWTTEKRSFAFEYTGVRSQGFRADVDAGPVEIEFTNATDRRYALLIVNLPDEYSLSMQPRLSGAAVLSNQTFLDLFADESIVAGEGLGVRRLALLFTDLRASTELYDRIGDMKAFDLVRQHFGYLRECIARNSGALVKTIGDAVMASFVDPLDALRAALDMRARIAQFNTEAGGDHIGLKVGLHTGACLAVTLNDRLDYFGQTVNIAARVQGLSEADEIVLTEDVMLVPGAADLVAGFEIETSDAALKGVAGPVRLHRIGSANQSQSRFLNRR